MQSYFYISNIQIPIELKPLYLKISNEFETDCAFNKIAERKRYKQVQTELRYRRYADSIHPYCYVADNLGGFLSGKAARSASARSDNPGKFNRQFAQAVTQGPEP